MRLSSNKRRRWLLCGLFLVALCLILPMDFRVKCYVLKDSWQLLNQKDKILGEDNFIKKRSQFTSWLLRFKSLLLISVQHRENGQEDSGKRHVVTLRTRSKEPLKGDLDCARTIDGRSIYHCNTYWLCNDTFRSLCTPKAGKTQRWKPKFPVFKINSLMTKT